MIRHMTQHITKERHHTLWIIIAFQLLAPSSYAEIYRWTDAQGKTHFSDHPPEEQITSEEVSDQLSPLNRDSSSGETQKLQQLFQQATPEEKALQQKQQAEQRRQNKRMNQACQKAKQQLRILKGRVFFTDDNGKEMVVSEEERERRAQQLEQEIRRRC